MPRPVYKIGNNNFLTIRGEPTLPRQMLELDQRHGVNGTEFTQVGSKGEPFTLITERDYLSVFHAKLITANYRQLITGGPVELIINDHSSILQKFKVQVLFVNPLQISKIKTPVGGLETHVGGVVVPAYAWVRWDLIAVAT